MLRQTNGQRVRTSFQKEKLVFVFFVIQRVNTKNVYLTLPLIMPLIRMINTPLSHIKFFRSLKYLIFKMTIIE